VSIYSETCLDSNVLIRSVEEDPAPGIKQLWREWLRDKVMLHAPALLRYEVVNALHQMRRAGTMDEAELSYALADAFSRPIVWHDDEKLHAAALRLAGEFKLSAAYESQYLALAAHLGIELWTTDAELFKAVEGRLAWVHLVS
jgi:predicted nucleic acid-binding protein